MLGMESYKRIIKARGYKITRQRMAVIEVLKASKQHMRVEDIHNEVQKKNPTFGLATIYRATVKLHELGILNKVILSDGISRYELVDIDDVEPKNNIHMYFICKECGIVKSFKSKLLNDIGKELEKEMGFILEGYEMKVFGKCSKCNKNK